MILQAEFPHATECPTIIRQTDDYTDLDFTLLRAVATWFTKKNAQGLTPRQVPIPGVHAKWLNTTSEQSNSSRRKTTSAWHPRTRTASTSRTSTPDTFPTGARQHDSATVGYTMTPA